MQPKTKYILILSMLCAIVVLAQTVVTQLTVDVTDIQRTALRWYARQVNKDVAARYLASGNTNTPPEITWQQGADLLFKARMDKIVKEHKAFLDAKVATQYSASDTNIQSQIQTILNVNDN